MISGNFPVVVIGDANIKKNIHNKGKIEKGEIETPHLFAYPVLHSNFYPKKPERLNEYIQCDQKDEIREEFLFQFNSIYEHQGTDYQIYFLFQHKCNKFATDSLCT